MIEHKRLSRGAMSTRLIDHCAPNLGAGFEAPELESVQDHTHSAVFVTLLEIVGGGIVYAIYCKTDALAGEIKITIDGHTETIGMTNALNILQYETDISNANYTQRQSPSNNRLFRGWFQDGLKIEYRITTAAAIYSKCDYGVV